MRPGIRIGTKSAIYVSAAALAELLSSLAENHCEEILGQKNFTAVIPIGARNNFGPIKDKKRKDTLPRPANAACDSHETRTI